MTLLPSSPDLKPTESLWAVLQHENYRKEKQSSYLNRVWEAVVAGVQKVAAQEIQKLTDPID